MYFKALMCVVSEVRDCPPTFFSSSFRRFGLATRYNFRSEIEKRLERLL